MSSIRLTLIAMSCALVGIGCRPEEQTCPRVAGQFQALYTPLTGSCGEVLAPPRVAIVDGPQPVQTSILTFPNGRLTTEVVRRGCTVQMTQLFESPSAGKPQSYITGPDLAVQSANELRGLVSMTRYDTQGNVACSGSYDAHLVKESATIGAAVSGVGGIGGH